MLVLTEWERKVVIGGSVGTVCMVLSTVLVFSILVLRHRYKHSQVPRQQQERERARALSRGRISSTHSASGQTIMTQISERVDFHGGEEAQSQIFTKKRKRSSFRNQVQHAEPAEVMMDPYRPPIHPLHTYHDPFSERNLQRSDLGPSSNTRNQPPGPGSPGVVPFRSSTLPATNVYYSPDGRLQSPNTEFEQSFTAHQYNSSEGHRTDTWESSQSGSRHPYPVSRKLSQAGSGGRHISSSSEEHLELTIRKAYTGSADLRAGLAENWRDRELERIGKDPDDVEYEGLWRTETSEYCSEEGTDKTMFSNTDVDRYVNMRSPAGRRGRHDSSSSEGSTGRHSQIPSFVSAEYDRYFRLPRTPMYGSYSYSNNNEVFY